MSRRLRKIWVCNDIWMDILPFFRPHQLGLKIALLSPRFDVLVDTHFNVTVTALPLCKWMIICKEYGPKSKLKAAVQTDHYFVDFPLPDHHPLPNKIRFANLHIYYIDHSVLKFLRSNKHIFDRRGTMLELSVPFEQHIWDAFVRELWPIFAPSIQHLDFAGHKYLDMLRRLISPTILTDLNTLNTIGSNDLFPDEIAADDGPNATAGMALSKWLHTPRNDGQPKQLYFYLKERKLWFDNYKQFFLRATTSVSYNIWLTNPSFDQMQIVEPFELVNERTNEKLILMMLTYEDASDEFLGDWLLKRCPIGETVVVQQQIDAYFANNNMNSVIISLERHNCIGPLSPPTVDEEAGKSNVRK